MSLLFNELAELCINNEIAGVFVCRNGDKYPSSMLNRGLYISFPYRFSLEGGFCIMYNIEGNQYNDRMSESDIIKFIPDDNTERIINSKYSNAISKNSLKSIIIMD